MSIAYIQTMSSFHDDIWRPVIAALLALGNKKDGATRASCHRTHMLVCKQWYKLIAQYDSAADSRAIYEDSYALYGIAPIRIAVDLHREAALPPTMTWCRWLIHRPFNWATICSKYILAEWFMEEFEDCLDWRSISECQRLTEKFIIRHAAQVIWPTISEFQRLSEGFIARHKRLVCWYWITRAQVLSEDFIRRYARYIVWLNVLTYQEITPAFARWCHKQAIRNREPNTNMATLRAHRGIWYIAELGDMSE